MSAAWLQRHVAKTDFRREPTSANTHVSPLEMTNGRIIEVIISSSKSICWVVSIIVMDNFCH